MLNEKLRMFLQGRVRFTAGKGFIPAFLDTCAGKNVRLRDVKEKEGVLRAFVSRQQFGKMCETAEKSGMEVNVESRDGLAFLLRRYRKRWGILVGALLAFVLTGILSSMVWQVQVSGCEKLSEDYVLAYFEDLGVRPGVFQKSIDVVACRDKALYEMKEVLWITLYLDDCIAKIEVRERAMTDERTENTVSNIVASYGGEIIRADIYEGEPYARVGRAVAKGDLLVGGALMMPHGGVRFVRAKADVIARTRRTLSCSVSLQQDVFFVQKSRIRRCISLFGLRIPLTPVFGMQVYESAESCLFAGEIVLPVGVLREGCRKLETARVQTDKQIVLLQLFSEFALQETQMRDGKTIVSRELKLEEKQGKLYLSGSYVCEENIGKEVKLEIEDDA